MSAQADGLRSLVAQVKSAAAGMLPLSVYQALYRAARDAGGGTFVEIGTAQGAATIVLALGARAGGKPFHIYTVDPFDRGSRLPVGSRADNVALVRSGFEAFGVGGDITIIAGESSDLLKQHDVDDVRLLLLDADGRIDRDLLLLLDRLDRDATVIIDDIDDRVFAYPEGASVRVDQKHRLSHLIAEALCEAGYLSPTRRIAQTGFYRKGKAVFDASDMSELALSAYRQLVELRIERSQIGARARSRELLERRAARALRLYRQLRYGRR
jgi:predicted O-methyltransferase YrrM